MRKLEGAASFFGKATLPLLIAAALELALWSWRRWPDLLIDFGTHAYTAWRRTEGAKLFRDIGYYYGPLPPLIHLFLFKVLGVSLGSLYVWNLAVLIGV